jgi:hypothetical protein
MKEGVEGLLGGVMDSVRGEAIILVGMVKVVGVICCDLR